MGVNEVNTPIPMEIFSKSEVGSVFVYHTEKSQKGGAELHPWDITPY